MLQGLWNSIVAAKAAIFTGLIVFGLTLPLGYCKGHEAATAKYDAERALANTKALQIDAAAGTQASEERVTDALTVDDLEEGLLDAISETPDSAPDRVRVQLGCERLRRQGTSPADIPLVCGP